MIHYIPHAWSLSHWIEHDCLSVCFSVSVQALVISAGDNKEIQLPQNEVTLSAFALPHAGSGISFLLTCIQLITTGKVDISSDIKFVLGHSQYSVPLMQPFVSFFGVNFVEVKKSWGQFKHRTKSWIWAKFLTNINYPNIWGSCYDASCHCISEIFFRMASNINQINE